MSKNYTQLSLEQRYRIECYSTSGKSQKWIAEKLKVHPSTVCRELKRNGYHRPQSGKCYDASKAQEKATRRHKAKPKRRVFSEEMKARIYYHMTQDRWSPEIISKVSLMLGEAMVSAEWIYTWLWHCKHTNRAENTAYKDLHKYLKHGRWRGKRGRKKRCRGTIPNRIPIEKRPKIVEKRRRLGDTEIDLMVGKNHKGAVLVATDRATLHTRLVLLKSKESHHIARKLIRVESKNKYTTKTLTFDNDRAFNQHEKVGKALKAKTYFTRPYTSQDKGTVENRIGVLRRFLPKGTDLTFVTSKQLKAIEKKLNDRPVRKFDYKTPNQVLQKKIALIT